MSSKTSLIIDTDPGIDDAMTIFAALNSPEINLVALTTIFGNVPTSVATQNALALLELAGKEADVEVAEGSHTTLLGTPKTRIADFVHGKNGFGDVPVDPPKSSRAVAKTAPQYIVDAVNGRPGEVTILALGPLTNIALALALDKDLPTKWAKLVILGGAFRRNGNVNPAAEANFFGDPHAADRVLGAGGKVQVVGLDVTHDCMLTGKQLDEMRGQGRFGTFLADITKFYLQYHMDYYGRDMVYLHDPAAFMAVLKPNLFTWLTGPVRVATDGIASGASIICDMSDR